MISSRVGLWILLAISVCTLATEDCNGHGHKGDDQICICDNAWPEPGSEGWIGEDCQVQVQAPPQGATDLTNNCAAHGCNTLEENAWECFTAASELQWNFMSIYLNRTEGKGDPDLYGFGRAASTPPKFSQSTGFAFSDTSLGATIRTLAKRDYNETLFSEGTYLCVHNYGPGTLKFDLYATMDACQSSFTADGTSLLCHSKRDSPDSEKRYSECSKEGECICKAEYDRPVPNVFDGLGFEDCSAEVKMIDDSLDSFLAENETVEAAGWKFYGFNVTDEDFEVITTVAEKEGGRVEIFAKAGAPPGAAAGQFDLRSGWNPVPRERTHQIDLRGSSEDGSSETRTGLWFIGVFGAGSGGNYELALQKYACPGNCSSNGICDDTTHKCSCSESYAGADCSIFTQQLTYNSTIEKNTSAVFELEFYDMPAVTDAMLQGNVEVVVTAECSSTSYNPHVTARPALLFASGTYPTPHNYTHRLVMDLDRSHTLTLCASQLEGQHEWKAAVYNPLPSLPLNYTLSVEKVGRCLNECSGHGDCSSDGLCECSTGWGGGDCSVELPGGSKRKSHHGLFLGFISVLFWMAVGAAAAFGYVSFQGIPRWLPLRFQGAGFAGLGIYQELTENEGGI